MIKSIPRHKFQIYRKIGSNLSSVEVSDLSYYTFDLNQLFKFDGYYYLQYHKWFLEITTLDDLETFLDVYTTENLDLIISAAEKEFDFSHMGFLILRWSLTLDKKVEKNIKFFEKFVDITGSKYQDFLLGLLTRNVSDEIDKKCLNFLQSYSFSTIMRVSDESIRKFMVNSPKLVKNGGNGQSLSKREIDFLNTYMDDKEEVQNIIQKNIDNFESEIDDLFTI